MAINLNVLPPGANGYEIPYYEAGAIVVNTPFIACRGIYFGNGGNATIVMVSGNSVTFTAVPTGTFLPVAATNVSAATASNLVALY